MLKKRVIPVVLLSERRLVKGKKFENYRETGMPISAIRIYSSQDSDELALINIDRSTDGIKDLKETLKMAAEYCFMPLLAGGNIGSYEDACELFRIGADKVLINSALYQDTDWVKKLIQRYGSQSIVGGIDFKKINGNEIVYIENGNINTGKNIEEYSQYVESLGVGEIFLNDIDNDGMMSGMNRKAIDKVASLVNIPVIASGGIGCQYDILDIFSNTSASAVACASIFCFGDHSPIRIRTFLQNSGIDVRRIK